MEANSRKTPGLSKPDLVEWFEGVDFSGYSEAALSAAYNALVGDTDAESEAHEPAAASPGAPCR